MVVGRGNPHVKIATAGNARPTRLENGRAFPLLQWTRGGKRWTAERPVRAVSADTVRIRAYIASD
jgi:hypothetical protein